MNIGVYKKAITVFICRKLLKSENCVDDFGEGMCFSWTSLCSCSLTVGLGIHISISFLTISNLVPTTSQPHQSNKGKLV